MPRRIFKTGGVLWGTLSSTTSRIIPGLPICRHHQHHRGYITQNVPYAADKPLPRRSEPLRILFCGSDTFSCASLSALHALHQAEPRLVESIDVLVRPGKPTGRGLRRIAVGPLFHLATSLGLPIHERDTFTGWDLPLPGRVTNPATGAVTIHPHPSGQHRHRPHHPFNLLIAVSFGLFVPPRVLSQLAYGGLNLHPSLLPDLRGPAPLQWTILARRPVTGVTLQTLHPTAFDRGEMLAQTPRPGLPVQPIHTTADLLALLAPEGARLLVDALRRDLHVGPPYAPVPDRVPVDVDDERRCRYAPKTTKADLAVDWARRLWAREHPDLYPEDGGAWTASDLARRFRALGAPGPGPLGEQKPGPGLWTYAVPVRNPRDVRVIFTDMEAVQCPPALRDAVLTIVQAKKASLDPQNVDPLGLLESPDKLANIVWVGRDVKAEGPYESRKFRLPLLIMDDGSVIIPIRMPSAFAGGIASAVLEKEPGEDAPLMDAVRVRRVKVEGSTEKAAVQGLAEFMETNLTLQDFANLDYAMDVMVKESEV